MEVVLFLPGILGSKLKDPSGVEVWPPTPWEALTGYKRIDQLLRTDLKPSGVIEDVCIDVYGGILAALETMGYEREGGGPPTHTLRLRLAARPSESGGRT